jgi:uncharacterized protein YdhG (YjbR/CyaY superfamily)
MKKPKSASGRCSASKRHVAPTMVDEYFARVQEPARTTLTKLRAAIRSAVPAEATEAISYRIPAFKRELDGLPTSKGTIQFPVDKPLPIRLITKLVRARVAQHEHKNRR